MVKEKIAFSCIDCGTVNIFNSKYSDGLCCMKCNGPLVPMGKAVVKESNRARTMEMKVKVDTTELDAATEKAKLLQHIREDNRKVLIIQAKCLMRDTDIKEEEERIKAITGMKVCIVNARYEVVGIDTGLNNG